MEAHAAVVECVRRDDLGVVGGEVQGRDDAAAGFEIGQDRGGELAFVEVAPSRGGEAAICRGEVGTRQMPQGAVACRCRRQAVGKENDSVVYQLTGSPSSAMRMAGAIASASDLRPKRSSARPSPSTEPGTQIDS
jgi:hypothetical protein